jgi:probable phosphoglycerate mutase
MQVGALYCSTLQRAAETAAIIGATLGLGFQPDSRLVELSYGKWEGKTHEEIKNLTPESFRAWELDPARVASPEGESGEQLLQRVKPFLTELAAKHPHGNAAVVCHRTLCRLLICELTGIPLSEYRKRVPMDNAALNVFEWTEGKWSVLKINDTTHLSAPLPEIATTL